MRKIFALMMFVAATIVPTHAGNDIDALIDQIWAIDTDNLAVPTVSMGKAASFELQVDVACAAFTMSLGNDPFQQPFPAGQPFVIQGYIFPGGTFAANGGESGINEDGSPEFPDELLGIWTCRGWLMGPTPTTLIFNMVTTGDSVILDGFEPFRGNAALRPVTGGTGTYNLARGQATQGVVGINGTGAPNFVFDFTFRPRIDFKAGPQED